MPAHQSALDLADDEEAAAVEAHSQNFLFLEASWSERQQVVKYTKGVEHQASGGSRAHSSLVEVRCTFQDAMCVFASLHRRSSLV